MTGIILLAFILLFYFYYQTQYVSIVHLLIKPFCCWYINTYLRINIFTPHVLPLFYHSCIYYPLISVRNCISILLQVHVVAYLILNVLVYWMICDHLDTVYIFLTLCKSKKTDPDIRRFGYQRYYNIRVFTKHRNRQKQ